MDETRLNIEAPLLSVRRSATLPSSTEAKKKTLDKRHTLPYPKSDLTKHHLTEPASVPLSWEDFPGKSKVNKEIDDGDDDYSFDTMSPSRSFFMNCSISGISGLESDYQNANKSGNFNTDPKTRDFMMNRFLPAAKAMTLQPPQYAASRQQSIAVEQAREVNRSFREEKKLLLKKHIIDIMQNSSQCEAEGESDDDHHHDDSAAKGCGLFSQLRIKNSLCLLNPLPAMRPKKGSRVRSYSPAPAVKKAIAVCKNKSSSEGPSPDIKELRKKWISQSCRFASSGESLQQDKLSPFRRSAAVAAGVSPCRSRPRNPLRGARLLGDSRRHGNIEENNSAVEKTLYIDTASTEKLPSSSHTCSLDDTGRTETQDSDINTKQIVIVDNVDSVIGGECVMCPLPPPLPKSPSESWLWRALPLVSAKNPLLHSNLGGYSQSKSQDSYTSSCNNNTKWETIVKTSNLHDDHVRYSQELITTNISQHLKS